MLQELVNTTVDRKGEDPVVFLTRLETANFKLRGICLLGWTYSQVLECFLAMPFDEYGSAADSLGMGIDVDFSRADVVA